MSYYKSAITRTHTHPRVHPLFLSLMAVFAESNQMPNISSVSESDLRAERENYYMSPNVLPPLDIHFDGKNGMAKCYDCAYANPRMEHERQREALSQSSAHP